METLGLLLLYFVYYAVIFLCESICNIYLYLCKEIPIIFLAIYPWAMLFSLMVYLGFFVFFIFEGDKRCSATKRHGNS